METLTQGRPSIDTLKTWLFFFLGLQAKYLVPASTVLEIASEMRVLQDMQYDFTMDLFSRGLQEYGVPDEALQNLGKRVQIIQITLGHDDKGRIRHFHYVPILKILKAIPRNESVRHQILNPIREDESMLCDIGDGRVLKFNDLFASDPIALQIMLFQDAFEVANPLGSAWQKQSSRCVLHFR